MKKLLIIPALALSLFVFAPSAFAATCTGPSDQASCGAGNICQQDATSGFYTCVAAGTGSGTCTGRNDTSCGAGNSCQQDANGFYACFPNSGSAANTTVNAGNSNTSTGFVPLVPIPGLTDNVSSASANNLATFLNNLYKYLIGLAAILAVIQIIRGGLEYATQDSVSKKDDGKHHIQQAILGLVLILSPVLIFSLINPSILNLGINLPPLDTKSGNYVGTINTPPVACEGNDCSKGYNQCTALAGGEKNGKPVCMKNGVIDPAQPEPIIDNAEAGIVQDCPKGDTTAIQCDGAAAVNGAGQAGLSSANIIAGADPKYDGKYMDLIKFTGKDPQAAAAAAQSYACQNGSSQTKGVISCSTSEPNCELTVCYTPSLTYRLTRESSGGVDLESVDDHGAFDTYRGECLSLNSALKSAGALANGASAYFSAPGTILSLRGSQTQCSPTETADGAKICSTGQVACKPGK